jgi:hypothetical protein
VCCAGRSQVCMFERIIGQWMTQYDIVEVPEPGGGKGKLLKLEKQEENGVCLHECETIAKACEVLSP